ncbi:hypothetical protein CP988_18005, partial [Enterococcus faecium]
TIVLDNKARRTAVRVSTTKDSLVGGSPFLIPQKITIVLDNKARRTAVRVSTTKDSLVGGSPFLIPQ